MVTTAVLAEIGAGHEASFLNYGHIEPMLVRRDGIVDFPRPPTYALPLGLDAHTVAGDQAVQHRLRTG
ncbi:hypothetical protein QFZ56_006183 [Streptomyces achromogenes]|uniref:Uncharacterized protein n=1 Tax=Streptomyces achromogenes TaxID=67255 RepID=A0ABU0Q972_STRAH|nr:hypothetical protein [Streptomyces achromogenes]MDQ0687220.1 hypothetical protein [Streptomyces achromogenes]